MKQLRRIEGERGLDKIFAESGKEGITRIVIPRSGATRNLPLPDSYQGTPSGVPNKREKRRALAAGRLRSRH